MPRGRPIDETEEEARDAALVGERDVGEAQAFARANLPAPFQRLAEAESLSPEETQARRRENGLSPL